MKMGKEREQMPWGGPPEPPLHAGHPGPGRPLPPHLRETVLRLSLEPEDWAILNRVFGDEDTASAAAGILLGAPPEIQALAFQVMKLIQEVE